MVHGWASSTKNAQSAGESIGTMCDLMGQSMDVVKSELEAIVEALIATSQKSSLAMSH